MHNRNERKRAMMEDLESRQLMSTTVGGSLIYTPIEADSIDADYITVSGSTESLEKKSAKKATKK